MTPVYSFFNTLIIKQGCVLPADLDRDIPAGKHIARRLEFAASGADLRFQLSGWAWIHLQSRHTRGRLHAPAPD